MQRQTSKRFIIAWSITSAIAVVFAVTGCGGAPSVPANGAAGQPPPPPAIGAYLEESIGTPIEQISDPSAVFKQMSAKLVGTANANLQKEIQLDYEVLGGLKRKNEIPSKSPVPTLQVSGYENYRGNLSLSLYSSVLRGEYEYVFQIQIAQGVVIHSTDKVALFRGAQDFIRVGFAPENPVIQHFRIEPNARPLLHVLQRDFVTIYTSRPPPSNNQQNPYPVPQGNSGQIYQ